jgi:hypothetical protein
VDGSLSQDDVLALITFDTAGSGNVSVDYDGNVNNYQGVDSADAQIVYALYNRAYQSLSDLSVLARLEADVNGDGVIDTLDVRAIHAIFLGIDI